MFKLSWEQRYGRPGNNTVERCFVIVSDANVLYNLWHILRSSLNNVFDVVVTDLDGKVLNMDLGIQHVASRGTYSGGFSNGD